MGRSSAKKRQKSALSSPSSREEKSLLSMLQISASICSSAGLIPPFGGVCPEAIDNVVASIREAGEKATLQVNELARAAGVISERLIVEGNPPSEILRIAEDEKIDTIVMGSIGKTGLEKVPHGKRSGKSSSQLKAACLNSSLK